LAKGNISVFWAGVAAQRTRRRGVSTSWGVFVCERDKIYPPYPSRIPGLSEANQCFRLAAYEDHGHTENTTERGSLRGALHKAVVRPKFPIRPRPLPSLMVKSKWFQVLHFGGYLEATDVSSRAIVSRQTPGLKFETLCTTRRMNTSITLQRAIYTVVVLRLQHHPSSPCQFIRVRAHDHQPRETGRVSVLLLVENTRRCTRADRRQAEPPR